RSTSELDPGDFRRGLSTFSDANLGRNLALVAVLEDVARELDATPAQVALAWVLARGEDVVPIPGTARRKRLEENAAAAALHLTAEQLARLDRTFAPGTFAGYNNWGMDELVAVTAARQTARG